MASFSYRGRELRFVRPLRRRNDSEDDCVVNLDWDKPAVENLQEILYHITRRDNVTKGQRLAYLNCFTKFCGRIDPISPDKLGLTLDEIFCCLRVALFHEAGDVRAAGLRAIRYLLRNDEAAEALCRVNLPLLICRSMDIVLDNRSERIQALRLVRKLLSMNPKRFPAAIIHCLMAIARDGAQERDMLVRACCATLGELILVNPHQCVASGGLSAIISCVMQGSQTQNICEALLGSLLYLLNAPNTRNLLRIDQDLQHFVAPFTDVHGFGGVDFGDSQDARELRYNMSKIAIISMLRSWPGLIFLCRIPPEDCNIPNGLESLISTLYLPYNEVHRNVMELVFELFYLRIPEWTSDFEAALLSADPSSMQESWHLFDNFVAAEGMSILPHIAKNRANLTSNYMALLLFALVNCGLLDALVSVIINCQDESCAVIATILLGELLHLSSRLLSSELALRCHSLPSMIGAASSESLRKRQLANAAISSLNRIHNLKLRGPVPCSLYLDQLMQFCQAPFASAASRNKLKHYLRREGDDMTVIQAIKDTQVIGREFNSWDWDLIDAILQWPGQALKKIDDNNHHKAFVKRLVVFYKPSSKMFSQVTQFNENSRMMVVVGQHFLDFLLEAEESKAMEHIDDLIMDLDSCLAQIAIENPSQNSVLSPSKLLNNLSHYYFLFIGRLTNTVKGNQILEKTRVYQYLLDLISLSAHDVYMKLIVSSLDYSKETSFSRTVLTKVLTCSSEESRLYATNYLRVLLRAKINDFHKWAIELLVQQLFDKSSAVSLAAADILDEACDSIENLEALISIRPSLLHIGDTGILLITRYLSIPSGFKYLRDSNYLDYELKRWQKSYNLKYVKIVEDALNESFTCHKRNDDGCYGRRKAEKRSCQLKNAFVPPHIYGQLALSVEGVGVLNKDDCLQSHYQTIMSSDLDSELSIVQLKAALWAVGHVGSTVFGFPLVAEAENEKLFPRIVWLAAESPIISIRGTCFFVLGLLATTMSGADLLRELGWQAIRHDHHEKWTLSGQIAETQATVEMQTPAESRRYTWSMSSTTTKLAELDDAASIRTIDWCRNESFLLNDTHSDQTGYGSLPSLNLEASGDNKMPKKLSLQTSNKLSKNLLPRVASLSPQHYRNMIDLRPRSSSDCPNGRDKTSEGNYLAGNEDVESSNGLWMDGKNNTVIKLGNSLNELVNKPERCDSGLIEDVISVGPGQLQTTTRMQTLDVRPLARRKTSEPSGMFFGREERSDSNESSNNSSKSRSGSFAESTSGVSAGSYESTNILGNRTYRSNNLSPIASLSSIGNSIQTSAIQTLALVNPLLNLTSARPPRTPTTPTLTNRFKQNSYESISNHNDHNSLGYCMKMFRNQTIAEVERSMYQYSPNINRNRELSRYSMDSTASDSTVKSRRSSTIGSEPKNRPAEDECRFMGLAVPMHKRFLFNVPDDCRSSQSPKPISFNTNYQDAVHWKTHVDRLSKDQILFNDGLELHSKSNCLLCFRTSTASSSDHLNANQFKNMPNSSPTRKSQSNPDTDSITATSPSLEINMNATSQHPTDFSNIPNYILNRREVLRFVTALAGSVHAKQAEQGLLNLKQKYGSSFEDICLYSEISLQLAMYHFRLSARRFLQELFLDVNFDQIYSAADQILLRLSDFVSRASSSRSTTTHSDTPLEVELEPGES